jgi:hypothetical protein
MSTQPQTRLRQSICYSYLRTVCVFAWMPLPNEITSWWKWVGQRCAQTEQASWSVAAVRYCARSSGYSTDVSSMTGHVHFSELSLRLSNVKAPTIKTTNNTVKPSLIRLQLIRIEIRKIKNSVHGWVHTFRKADETLVCSDKTWNSFFKPASLRSKQVQLLSLLSMNKCIDFL